MTETSSCPYKNIMNKFSFFGDKKNIDSSKTCRFSSEPIIETIKEEKKEEKNTKEEQGKEQESSDDENKNRGGCPMMNQKKKDPGNKHYESKYEISRYGQLDFLFDLRGGLSKEDYLEQTQIFRKYPRHMKYSLFHNDEKITKLRTKEFPVIYFVYDEMKDKGNKLYKKRKYRESIDYYVYAYSMLRWIEFKDPNKQKEFIATPNLDPILDNDIKECKAFLDDVAVEEESYNASIVFLLMCLSNSYMELRHYSEAIDCLDECIGIAQDKVADLYFRRSQARTYNKLSTEEDLKIAKADIEKAISLNSKEQMYQEHFEKLKKISEEKKVKTIEKIEQLIKKAKASSDRLKERGMKLQDCFFDSKEDHQLQFKVLKEMENKYILALKFFTETKNEEQMDIAYNEIEAFMETYENFLFYYFFDSNEIEPTFLDCLSDEIKNLLGDDTIKFLIDQHKYKIADDIFGKGNFNFAVYKFAIEKVMDDEKEEKEKLEKENAKPSISWFESYKNNYFYIFFSVGLFFFTVCIIIANYYFSQSNISIFGKIN